jgi:dolichol-phosphate mannosyltransferase
MKLSFIIPCYNEEKGIINLYNQFSPIVDDLLKVWDVELIFIDDGSTDGTYKLIKEHFSKYDDVKIIRHKKNLNLGSSIRNGFKVSSGDIVITMDSDCTYNPKGIYDLINMIDDETSIVTASPYHPKGGVNGVPPYRIFLSKRITNIYQILTKSKIYTFTALFRAYKKEVVKNVSFNSNDFIATAEHLIKSSLEGYKIKEYPTILHVRRFGSSKMKLFRVIVSHLKFILEVIKFRLKGNFD